MLERRFWRRGSKAIFWIFPVIPNLGFYSGASKILVYFGGYFCGHRWNKNILNFSADVFGFGPE